MEVQPCGYLCAFRSISRDTAMRARMSLCGEENNFQNILTLSALARRIKRKWSNPALAEPTTNQE